MQGLWLPDALCIIRSCVAKIKNNMRRCVGVVVPPCHSDAQGVRQVVVVMAIKIDQPVGMAKFIITILCHQLHPKAACITNAK